MRLYWGKCMIVMNWRAVNFFTVNVSTTVGVTLRDQELQALCWFCLFWDQALWSWTTLNFWSFYLCLPNAGITGVNQHAAIFVGGGRDNGGQGFTQTWGGARLELKIKPNAPLSFERSPPFILLYFYKMYCLTNENISLRCKYLPHQHM